MEYTVTYSFNARDLTEEEVTKLCQVADNKKDVCYIWKCRNYLHFLAANASMDMGVSIPFTSALDGDVLYDTPGRQALAQWAERQLLLHPNLSDCFRQCFRYFYLKI